MSDKKLWKIFHDKQNTYEYLDFSHLGPNSLAGSGIFGYHFLFCESYFWPWSPNNCVYEMWECRLQENDVVVDLGANVGFFTYHASKKASTVYSIDGSPEAYSCLVENCKDLHNVHTLNVSILSEKQEQSHLWTFKGNQMRMTLDDFMKMYSLEKIDFLKCDIEGGEWEFFSSLSPETLSKIDRIAIETHNPWELDEFHLPGKERASFLWQYGSGEQTMLYFTTPK